MRAEEIEHRRQQRGVAQPVPQIVRLQPGERKQPLRPCIVRQNPAEGLERQRGRIDGGSGGRSGGRSGGWSIAKNCQPRFQSIERYDLDGV